MDIALGDIAFSSSELEATNKPNLNVAPWNNFT